MASKQNSASGQNVAFGSKSISGIGVQRAFVIAAKNEARTGKISGLVRLMRNLAKATRGLSEA